MSASVTKKVSKARAGGAVGDEPSAESLREIPPLDPKTAVSFGRGEEGLELARSWSRAVRGRPKKGTEPAGTSTRSVRLQGDEWAALDAFAKARGIKAHAAMREAIVHWIARSQLKADKRAATEVADLERVTKTRVTKTTRGIRKRYVRVETLSKPASSRAHTSRDRAS